MATQPRWITRAFSLNGGSVKHEDTDPSGTNPRWRRRQWLAAATVAGTALAGGGLAVMTASSASAATVDTNAWYTLINRNSGKALDVCSASTADGACVQQYAN